MNYMESQTSRNFIEKELKFKDVHEIIARGLGGSQ